MLDCEHSLTNVRRMHVIRALYMLAAVAMWYLCCPELGFPLSLIRTLYNQSWFRNILW